MNNIPHNISDELSLIQSDLMALLRRVNNLQQRIAEMTEKADNAIVEDETAQYIEPVVDTKQDCEPETYAPEASEISIPDKTNEPEAETRTRSVCVSPLSAAPFPPPRHTRYNSPVHTERKTLYSANSCRQP